MKMEREYAGPVGIVKRRNMANHREFNVIIQKLKDRHFFARVLFDEHNEKVSTSKKFGQEIVYLKSDIDEIITRLKERFTEVYDSREILKKEKADLEIQNYCMKKKFKLIH